MHRPLPLQLQAQRAFELQRRGEQHRSRHRFAERVANRRRIVAMLQQRAPRRVQVHDVPADRVVLEQETVQAIAVVHGRSAVDRCRADSPTYESAFSSAGRSPAPGSPCRRSPSSPGRRRSRTACPCPSGSPPAASGFAAITSSMIFSIAPVSVICLQALRFDDRVRVLALSPHLLEHFLGDLARDGGVGDARQQAGEAPRRRCATA